MFAQVLRVQQIKIFRSAVLWVELALLAGFALMITVLRNVTDAVAGESAQTVGGQLLDMLQTVGSSTMIGMLAVILAGALMAQEYGWRSLHLWLSKGVARTTYLWTKFVALLIPLVVFFIGAGIVTFIASALLVEGGAFAVDWGEIGLAVAAGVYASLPYAALAMFLAIAGRSMLLAIGGGLAITLIAENMTVQLAGLLGDWTDQVVPYFPTMLAQSVLGTDPVNGPAPLDAGPAAALIALYTVVLLVAATIWLRRQDLSD